MDKINKRKIGKNDHYQNHLRRKISQRNFGNFRKKIKNFRLIFDDTTSILYYPDVEYGETFYW